MGRLIELNKVNMSKYVPSKEEDYNNLSMYKSERLLNMLKYDDSHRRKIIDYLFFSLKEKEEIEEFKTILKEIDEYDNYVSEIICSANDKNMQHLVLYYENTLIDELYGGEDKLAKQIYKNRKKYGQRDYCFDHLLKLASIANDYTTLLIIKEKLIKLVKQSTRANYIFNIHELLTKGAKITEENILSLRHIEEYLIEDFTNKAEKTYRLNQRRKNDNK